MLRACPSTINVPAAARRLEPLIVYYSLHVSKFSNPQVENAHSPWRGRARTAEKRAALRKRILSVYLHYALGAPATPQKTLRQPRDVISCKLCSLAHGDGYN